MDTVTVLRDLWRIRVAVLCVWLLALLAGTAVLYKISFPPQLQTRKYDVGIATTSILIDTPSSQVVDVAPKGSDSLGVRANLIASLMVDGDVEALIARTAGLNPNDLVGIVTSAQAQGPVAKPKDPRAPVLTTRVLTDNDGLELPLIQIEAQAANAAAAAKLASAAVSGLRDYLDSKAAAQRIPDAQRLQVTGLGVMQARTAARGPKDIFALAAVLFVFGFGCASILGVKALVRAWRAAVASEGPGDDEPARTGDQEHADDAATWGIPARHPAVGDRWDVSWQTPPTRPSLVVARPPREKSSDDDDEPEARSA
jgi:hypothetical protein